MTADNPTDPNDQPAAQGRRLAQRSRRKPLSGRRTAVLWTAAAVAAVVLSTIWLGIRASEVRQELTAASQLVPRLKAELVRDDGTAAATTVEELKTHTSKARSSSSDPLWTLAGMIPWIGKNFQAVRDVATSADEIVHSAASPLVTIYQSLDWQNLTPGPEGIDLAPLAAAQPTIALAAQTVTGASDRLDEIDTAALIPQLSGPLAAARDEVSVLKDSVNAAADVATVAPAMLGGGGQRSYLLMIQNNAETRATGGIPGALAVLNVDKGKLSLGVQSSAGDVGVMSPTLPIDSEQEIIYSARMGKFMQDATLTPDFPTAASTAQGMWERKSGQRVDGVISLDPVALSYLLGATGPIELDNPEFQVLSGSGLPTVLNGGNVVETLLSDVYMKIGNPKLQDAYFAGVAQEIFASLSGGQNDSRKFVEALTRGSAEGRLLAWSGSREEQATIAKYPLGGSIAGPSVAAAQFGVYFNDGTGAKMDYYVKRTVQLVKQCPKDGYEQTAVRVTSTNTAPADAASSLPTYVTGGGIFGVPPGSVQTNIVAYGPVQANMETVELDGQRAGFAPYVHRKRPVGVLAIRLSPGESRTVEFTFGKIVQHAELNVVVTPTVQAVNDVILPTQMPSCGR